MRHPPSRRCSGAFALADRSCMPNSFAREDMFLLLLVDRFVDHFGRCRVGRRRSFAPEDFRGANQPILAVHSTVSFVQRAVQGSILARLGVGAA